MEKKNNEESLRGTLRIMKERFKSRLDENVFDGNLNENIFHGLKLINSASLYDNYKNFCDACFCNETQVGKFNKKYYNLYEKISINLLFFSVKKGILNT